jgi:hypothetical protein
VAPEVVDGETPAGDDEGRKPLRTH